jgi:hypothetical protein
MKDRKTPKAPKPQADKVPPPPASDGSSDTLGSAPHATPDGSAGGPVERERPQGGSGPSDAGRGSDANVNDTGRGLGPDVESESDADSRSRRRDLGP